MRGRLIAACVVLALVAASCGNSGDDKKADTTTTPKGTTAGDTTPPSDLTKNVPVDAPGVTDTEIHVAVIASKTNPLNGKYAEVVDGIRAYFEMMNTENGGIYGRKLLVTKERDDIVGLNQLPEVQASLAEDNAFATFIASLMGTGIDALDAAGMPTFMWNIRPEFAGHENVFGSLGALCLGCTGSIGPWLAQKLGATKIGILAYGVANESKLCGQGGVASFEKYPTAEVVFYDESLEFAAADLSSQVAQMKEKGVEFITTCMDINETIVLAKEMKKQGLNAIQHLPQGYDADTVAANADLLEGDIVIPQFVAYEQQPQLPEVKTFLEWMKKTGKEPVELAATGWILAFQFIEGLKLAGPEFSQQKVIDALNTVTDMRVNGMIQPIDWTRQHTDPKAHPEADSKRECANFLKVVGGKYEPLFAEPGKPWVCFERNAPTIKELGNMTFEP